MGFYKSFAVAMLLPLAMNVAMAQTAPAVSPAPAAEAASKASAQSALQQERSRIQNERNAANARFAAEEKACYQKFAATDCLNDVRARKREIMADLRRQDISLNDAERKRAGADQLRSIEERNSPEKREAAARQREQALRDQADREKRSAEKATHREGAAGAEDKNRQGFENKLEANERKRVSEGSKAAQASKERERFDAKQKEAADHAAQLEKRLKANTKPRGKPLGAEGAPAPLAAASAAKK